jgi:Acetyltransferases, including N-acetylases of ribosomal proteins
MSHLRLRTERLELVAGNLELSEAELNDRRRLGELLNARVLYWPPPLNDEDSMKFSRDYFAENPDNIGWGVWYFILCEGEERIIIGNGGFKGKPSVNGTVEIGYSIIEEFQRRGYASEAVRALVSWAFDHTDVKRVIAETLPELSPSIRVLEKNGFRHVGKGSEEGIIRYAIRRGEFIFAERNPIKPINK